MDEPSAGAALVCASTSACSEAAAVVCNAAHELSYTCQVADVTSAGACGTGPSTILDVIALAPSHTGTECNKPYRGASMCLPAYSCGTTTEWLSVIATSVKLGWKSIFVLCNF